MLNPKIKIACFTEHWMNEGELEYYSIRNFRNISKFCRVNKKNGGTVIYIHRDLRATELIHLTKLSEERVCEISACYLKIQKLVIINIYRAPDIKIDEFLTKMTSVLEFSETFDSSTAILLTGDFNVHFNNINDPNTQKVTQLFLTFGFQHLINEPTHKKGNCLDNIFCNLNSDCINVDVIQTGLSDHSGIIAEFKNCVVNISKSKLVKSYGYNNIEAFNAYLKNENWSEVYLGKTSEVKYNSFENTFIHYYNICFPMVKRQIKQKN